MSLSEEYLTSFTFSIFLEDITTELQLRRRYSEQTPESPLKPKSAKLSISTVESLNSKKVDSDRFSLSKFCPHFETYRPNGEFFGFGVSDSGDEETRRVDKAKKGFYRNLLRKITKIVD